MFPYDDVEDLLEETEGIDPDAEITPTDYGINFDRNVMTGVQVDGLAAIKVWARNALMTPRYRYEIFTDEYGSDLEELIGHSYSPAYITCESRRMVEDCLLVHPNITGITDFLATMDKDTLTISFVMQTDFGDTETEVTI